MPLLTADFALLSYIDLATTSLPRVAMASSTGWDRTTISGCCWGGGTAACPRWRGICVSRLCGRAASDRPKFRTLYLLSSLQMDPVERVFPGSRFTDSEVDALFGRPVSRESRARLSLFRRNWRRQQAWRNGGRWLRRLRLRGGRRQGPVHGNALSLRVAYPFCDRMLREWVHHELPKELRVDLATMTNNVLIRQHIATRFAALPYVERKGSFRYDLRGLARCRFEQVHAFATEVSDVLPGAVRWLERNRRRLDNKYHASKFYLLAIVLPWIAYRRKDPSL